MKPLVVGNWKMFGSKASVDLLIDGLIQGLDAATAQDVDVLVCPPSVYLERVAVKTLKSSISLAAQNVCAEASDEGAYTGEISASMLKDLQCSHVLVGHSERRSYYFEDNALLAQKTQQVLSQGLKPIICIGETLEQRESGDTMSLLETQLRSILDQIDIEQAIVVAYEPVWAIGTGLSASAEQAQEVHAHIRKVLDSYSADKAKNTAILYGGSVKPENAADLMSQADIDGVLVGGASLKSQDFLKIITATV